MSISPTIATTPNVTSAADRATDAALAKATQKLAADRKAQAAASIIRNDQQAVAKATKAAAKADQGATQEPTQSTTSQGPTGLNRHA